MPPASGGAGSHARGEGLQSSSLTVADVAFRSEWLLASDKNSGVETAADAAGCCHTFHGGMYCAIHHYFGSRVMMSEKFGYTCCLLPSWMESCSLCDLLNCGSALFGAYLR